MTLRDVWRCVTVEPGALSVMIFGTSEMLMLSADNLAMDQVYETCDKSEYPCSHACMYMCLHCKYC